MIAANTDVITIFGKSWDMHVNEALSTTLNENLNMVKDSVSYLKENCSEVIFDAEHFFDGFKTNPEYAMKVLVEAESAGADWIILCDTNGGSLPSEVGKIFSIACQFFTNQSKHLVMINQESLVGICPFRSK